MKYRKTELIDAEQFDGSDEMVRKYDIEDAEKYGHIYAQRFVIHTLEGDLSIDVGDWIATGIDGEHWPIADDIFKRTYEPVEEKQ
ncbi:hypothetical protein IWT25_02437 [Secundilactobacillus pentosiphilus]|uniref:Phage protein n=1 Tax=Secundilactobacillus pentosiphilus TaxID=1714682 RepID=A0A1Z5IZJ5_9LACO|nr:hypothetical protein [Secundilactobacillus pentosiphilus]GAX07089.1 hypothetical protein IWT25_02437 [Secundilactobacillus pentosiphilus]